MPATGDENEIETDDEATTPAGAAVIVVSGGVPPGGAVTIVGSAAPVLPAAFAKTDGAPGCESVK
jgi:hypothetical protein